MTIQLTIKNYRCFADTNPVRIDFARGFTALVGPNNSGKSALLRFIYEYQGLWSALCNPHMLVSLGGKNDYGPLRQVLDLDEIVCDFTRRPLSFEAISTDQTPNTICLKSLSLKTVGGPNIWTGTYETVPRREIRLSSQRLIDQTGVELDWSPFQDIFSQFANCLFAPAFRNAINEGSGSFFDFLVGTSVVGQWNQWKAGTNRASKLAIQRITNDIRHIFGFESLEINSSADNKSLEVVVNGRPYRLNDLGSGLTQFIILFINVAVRKPALLLVDEPELNLHPRLQIDFLTALASYTSSGSVIFATHSLGLARAIADRIYTFSPTTSGTKVSPFESTPSYAQFAGEMGFGSYQELGFKTILMVEGPTEVKAIQQFLRHLGHDHDVVLLHLGGSSMICPDRDVELGELKRLTANIAILVNSERSSAGAPISSERARFLSDCKALGFLTHVTERRAIENYLPDRAVKAVKGESYRSLAPFELLKEANPGWGKSENWRIAREMSSEELLSTDIGKFLLQVCEL